MRHRAEHAEAELEKAHRHIAGVQDDNAQLQRDLINLEMGMMIQAKQFSDIAQGCDL